MTPFFQRPYLGDERLKRQIKLLFPSVLIDQLAATLLGFVNTIMTSNVSKEAVAGVGQVDAVSNIVLCAFTALAAGGTVLTAQAHGRGDRREADRTATQAMFWGGLAALVGGLLLCFFRVPLLRLLYPTVEQGVADASSDYCLWVALSCPLAFLISQGGGVFRGVNDPKTPLRISLFMNVINVLIGFVMIGGVGGIGGFGAFGAGLTIFLTRLIGAVWFLWSMLRHGSHLHFARPMRPDRRILGGCLRVGVPVMWENVLFLFATLFLQTAIARQGTVAISAHQVSLSLCGLLTLIPAACTIAVVTVVGNYAGERDRDGCRRAIRYINTLAFFASLPCVVLALAIPGVMALIYTRDPEVISVVKTSIRILSVGILLYPQTFISSIGFRGTGDVKCAMIVSTVSVWVLRAGLSVLLFLPLGLGIPGVWIAMMLDWGFRALSFTLHERRGRWLDKVPAPLPGPDLAPVGAREPSPPAGK